MTLRPGSRKSQRGGETSDNGEQVVGIKSIAAYLGFSERTMSSWRREFSDFPVQQDRESCVWYSTRQKLDEFRRNHADLFMLHKERRNMMDELRRSELAERRSPRW